MNTMRILAIDPGFGRCGIAVLEREDGTQRLLYSECIETASADAFHSRLSVVIAGTGTVLERFSPDAVALEKLFMGKNRTTAMRIAEVRGALIQLATENGIPVFEYSPAEVKSATAGWGKADKRQIATMLHALLKIEKKITIDDEYDAIAIGVTHFARSRPAP